jgi:hypothetical protein
MAKTRKQSPPKAQAGKRPVKAAKPARPKRVTVKKEEIVNTLAGMAALCSTLRLALEAYDSKKDRAVFHVPGPYLTIQPFPVFFDCFPRRRPGTEPEFGERLSEWIQGWKPGQS